MSAAAAEVEAAVEPKVEKRAEAPAEQRVVLHNISWELFEQMLEELGDNRSCRLAYDEGMLEIMSPKVKHEQFNRFLDRAVYVLARLLKVRFVSVGSMTCKRKDLQRGIEPDSSFYIQNSSRLEGRTEIDLDVDPPPDLMIEVDISHSSMSKLGIMAALGVPEFWQCDGNTLTTYRLEAGKYVKSDRSPNFGNLPLSEAIKRYFELSIKLADDVAALDAFEKWAREELSKR